MCMYGVRVSVTATEHRHRHRYTHRHTDTAIQPHILAHLGLNQHFDGFAMAFESSGVQRGIIKTVAGGGGGAPAPRSLCV